MALFTNLQSLSQTAGANPPDGSADAPSTIPIDLRLLGSFSALLRDGAHQWASAVSGTNTIVITVNGVSSLVAGQTFRFVAAGANTGAVTLNVNSLGAKNVNKFGATALVAGEIPSLSTVTVTYDGTNFQITGVAQPASLGGSGYQRFSSGLILQWGPVVTSGAGDVDFFFPIAFPNAFFVANATYVNATGSGNVTTTLGITSATRVTVGAYVASTGARASASVYIFALGN